MKRFTLALALLALGAAIPTLAQDAAQKPAEKTAEERVKEGFREEVVVVSASKTESTLINAPATMSVVGADTIATSPAQNYGDLLRSTPGLNVIQTSARDINMTSRQSTSTLATSQLVMLDGRSIYLDFFGLVLWDFVPQSTSEIKQIEVVRGPASAVWGANALTGVVNIITKSPRDAEGFNLNLQGGLFNRSKGSREDDGSGYLYGANFSYAQAPSEKLAWRLSAGYFNSDPFSRPVGRIPLDCHPLGTVPCRDAAGKAVPGGIPVGGALYPPDQEGRGSFANDGTSQPKVDARLDQELGTGGSGGRITYQGGYSGTTGIVHTGIGPFQIQSPSYLGYGKVQWTRNAMKLGVFGNFTDVKAPNLLLTDPDTGQPVSLNFTTQTYDVEFGNSNVIGGKNILSYGGNYRRNNFDITLTPDAEDRNEFGAYFQEEFFTERFRISVGARVDKFGNLDDAVFSPRVSVMYKPGVRHSIRLSFNRAFRSPSVVNNYLAQDIFAPTLINLTPLGQAVPSLRPLIPEPFFLRVKNKGSEVVSPRYPLKQESLDAYELAYTGSVGKTTLGIALYLNRQDDNINFTQLTPTTQFPQGLPGLTYYSPTNPAKGIGAVTRPAGHREPPSHGDSRQSPGPGRRPHPLPGDGGHLPEPRAPAEQGHRALDRPQLLERVHGLRQLLVPGHAQGARRGQRPDPVPDLRGGHSRQEPLQRRPQLERQALPGQRQPQLLRQGLLERRAERRVLRLHRLLCPGEREHRDEVEGRQDHHEPEGHEPHQRDHPAARLRRHHEDRGGVRGEDLHEVGPGRSNRRAPGDVLPGGFLSSGGVYP